ncbi:uncharacterized protein LY89DRAFT_685780 [Mollisia scopiformis]|uniref:Uncharacterized protein n=1 Tax=Mollisia scopiformis TaxID=149040 RepID=A0A194X715_MOLSC|nr:uncharacterized protein LY89DRAFT_685780 [Mollisia scopiformis]KUJ15879.1 hypothetical protein LY89DRAFT_685780 [Mollisia scopiformis]
MRGLVWNTSSAYARLGLRILFNLLLLSFGLIGDQCCKERTELQILLKQPLDLTHYTGWLHGSNAAWAMHKMKRLPAGWLGVVMILTGLMWTAADLAVSGLVVSIDVRDRCAFNTSGLYEVMYNESFSNYIVPYTVGNLFNLVTRAQVTSQANGGLGGIYEKVNGDPTFRADPEDILGQWNCHDVGDDQQYPAHDNITTVLEDLGSKNILFDVQLACSDDYPDNTYGHLVAWSSPRQDFQSTDPWDVRASIDTTANNKEPINMKSFLCSMNASSVEWVLGRTNPATTLKNWCDQLKGLMYENTLTVPPVANPAAVLESTLDAIIMISGASQSGPNITTSPIKDPTQGCLIPKASITWLVVLLLIVVILGTAGMLGYWLFLLRSVRKLRSWRLPSERGEVPNGLLSWMVQAVNDTGMTVSSAELNRWYLVPRGDGRSVRIAREVIRCWQRVI